MGGEGSASGDGKIWALDLFQLMGVEVRRCNSATVAAIFVSSRSWLAMAASIAPGNSLLVRRFA